MNGQKFSIIQQRLILILVIFFVQGINAEDVAKKAEQDRDDYLQQYVKDKDFPFNKHSFEIKEPGEYDSTITRTYEISYINKDCLLIERSISVSAGEKIVKGWQALKYMNNSIDMAQDGQGNSNKSDEEALQRRYNHYADSVESASTRFRVLRKEDEIYKWISTYKKWCQIAQTEHLANAITKNISKCCTGQFSEWRISEEDFKEVNFITPNKLKIGYGWWSEVEVARLEKLLSMIPDLDADVKSGMAKKAKEEDERATQNLLRLNEENRAKALLK